MGTRNITQVILNGTTLVSQYCQWDGYPDGQGTTVLEFLKQMDRKQFERRLRACVQLEDDIIKAHWDVAFSQITMDTLNKENADASDELRLSNLQVLEKYNELKKDFDKTGMVGFGVSDYFKEQHPTLQRDMGADILQHIYDSEQPVEVSLDLEFMNDSLFCEWVYVIDLDNNKLEVYEGFNKSPVPASNRFQIDKEPEPSYEDAPIYYPVTLLRDYDLDKLPTQERFIADCTDNTEDEEEETTTRTQAEIFGAVVTDLRGMASGDSEDSAMVNHIMNYIEANKDDFFEAIED